MEGTPENTPEEPTRAERRSLITESAIISLITVTAYLWALSYEDGFCDYFCIPYDLISLSQITLVTNSAGILLILVFLYLIIAIAYSGSTPTGRLTQHPKRRLVLILVLLAIVILGLFSSYRAGRRHEERIQEFSVIVQSPDVIGELVVLPIYGEYLITAPLDRSTKTIERKLYILKLSEISEKPLVFDNIGPLKAKREES